MEYKDYETGESISREQYIEDGLERGELLVRKECGCVIIQDRTADAYIVYCYKHEAAPDMFQALVEMEAYLENWHPESTYQLEIVRKSLAKAESK